MKIQWPKETELKLAAMERHARIIDTDFKRMWKRMPQFPDLQIGPPWGGLEVPVVFSLPFTTPAPTTTPVPTTPPPSEYCNGCAWNGHYVLTLSGIGSGNFEYCYGFNGDWTLAPVEGVPCVWNQVQVIDGIPYSLELEYFEGYGWLLLCSTDSNIVNYYSLLEEVGDLDCEGTSTLYQHETGGYPLPHCEGWPSTVAITKTP